MINIQQALSQAIPLLAPTSSSAQIDAEILLTHVLQTSRAFLYAHPEKNLENIQETKYQQLIEQRCEGIPIAYLTGCREFWSLPLHVNEATLIPRPETELLVEIALSFFDKGSTASLLDLGTGSGAIALALASERPTIQVLASDISLSALAMAARNIAHLRLNNVHTVNSDWFASIPLQCFDAIISNPPYIAEGDPHLYQGDLRFEPQQALISGVDGLSAFTQIINEGYDRLLPGGLLLLEHGYQQRSAVTMLLKQRGYVQIRSWQDVQGCHRVSGGVRNH
jgi:release factor glutamine methyltransferase